MFRSSGAVSLACGEHSTDAVWVGPISHLGRLPVEMTMASAASSCSVLVDDALQLRRGGRVGGPRPAERGHLRREEALDRTLQMRRHVADTGEGVVDSVGEATG